MLTWLIMPVQGLQSFSQKILSEGEINYAPKGFLRALGTEIVDENGRPIHLVGCWAKLMAPYTDYIFQDFPTHLQEAKELGMQTLRLGIDMEHYTIEPYEYNDNFFATRGSVDDIVKWCNANGIYIIFQAIFQDEFSPFFSYKNGHGFPAWFAPSEYYTNDRAGRFKAWTDFWRGTPPQEDNKNQVIDAWKHVVARYKNESCILAWEIPCNEPTSGSIGADEIKTLYYPFIRNLIDAIRVIDPDRLIIVETLDADAYDLLAKAADIQRPNVAYDVHIYPAGSGVLNQIYDPTAPAIPDNPIWNKAKLEEWIVENIVNAFMREYNRPVIIGEADTTTTPEAGNWHQWYWDLYEILDKYGIWVTWGFRAGTGDIYALWNKDGSLKDYVDVLTAESTFVPA